jgi:hypothetical protein
MQIQHIEMAVKRASEKTKSAQVFGNSRKQPKMFRAGLYARVSTFEPGSAVRWENVKLTV